MLDGGGLVNPGVGKPMPGMLDGGGLVNPGVGKPMPGLLDGGGKINPGVGMPAFGMIDGGGLVNPGVGFPFQGMLGGGENHGMYTYRCNQYWTCPPTVYAVQVQGIGGGGGGGTQGFSGGGGGGGAYAETLAYAVVPGTTYALYVGKGGVSYDQGASTSTDGEDTWFDSPANFLAAGGKRGRTFNNLGGIGGAAADCIADAAFDGGNGADGFGAPTGTTTGGGGGSSASPAGAGTNGSGTSGGAAPAGGGNGGNGDTSIGSGTPGAEPGGGGGGSYSTPVSPPFSGWSGGCGWLVLTW
jgi:hypothetical protein